MLGNHPLTRETSHDLAIRNHLYDENFLKDQERQSLLSLASFHSNAHDDYRQNDDSHFNAYDNEAKYRVFLESQNQGPELSALYYNQNNYPETNLYRSFPFKHSPIPADMHHNYSTEDAWYNDIGRAVRQAANQREEMNMAFSDANLLDYMDALRKQNYKGLSEEDKHAASHACHCVHGNEACCETEHKLHEQQMRKELEKHSKPHTDTLPHYGNPHYCITGDEPFCDTVRHREADRLQELAQAHRYIRHGGHY